MRNVVCLKKRVEHGRHAIYRMLKGNPKDKQRYVDIPVSSISIHYQGQEAKKIQPQIPVCLFLWGGNSLRKRCSVQRFLCLKVSVCESGCV